MKHLPESVERYLNRATRGLWGRKSQEVREELWAHLEERTLAHRVGGMGEEEARERALSELGDPGQVRAGMLRLYTLPTVMGSSMALVALFALAVAVLPRVSAQSVPGTFYYPTTQCLEILEETTTSPSSKDCFSLGNFLWLSQQDLKRSLEPQRVKFTTDEINNQSFLKLTFLNSTPVYVTTTPSGLFVFRGESSTGTVAAEGYVSLWSLLKAISYQQDVRLEVEGWDNPTLRFNSASLTIGTAERPVDGLGFYQNYLGAVLFDDLIGTVEKEHLDFVYPQQQQTRSELVTTGDLRRVMLAPPKGDPGVYGLITRLSATDGRTPGREADEPPSTAFMLSAVRTDAQGRVTFDAPNTPLRFVDVFSAADAEGTSALVRLGGGAATGGGWYEVVEPSAVRTSVN